MCAVPTATFGVCNSVTVVAICSYMCKCPINPITTSLVTQTRGSIVTDLSITRQRLVETRLLYNECAVTLESRNKPLLGNASVNTFSRLRSQQWDLRCYVASPQTQIPVLTNINKDTFPWQRENDNKLLEVVVSIRFSRRVHS
jgi:hypothetical protein